MSQEPTTLFIIRHAKPQGFSEAPDGERRLVPEGVATHRQICGILRDKGYSLDLILSSPLIRARQTAEITAEFLPAPIQIFDSLGVGFDASALLQATKDSGAESIAWVGHEPSLGEMVNNLVGERILLAGLAKSGVAIIEFQGPVTYGQGSLLGYLHPGAL